MNDLSRLRAAADALVARGLSLLITDVDGVLFDSRLSLLKVAEAMGYAPVPTWNALRAEQFLGLGPDVYRRVLAEAPKIEKILLIEPARDSLHVLKDAGFRIVALTAIAPENAERRRTNFQKFDLPIDTLHHVGLNTTKLHILNGLPTGIFVDDYLHNLDDGRQADPGHHLVLFDQPYNRGADLSAPGRHGSLQRMNGWADLAPVLERILATL